VTAIAATPHVRADFPTRATRIEAGVAELRRDFAAHEIPVDVLPGGEVDLAWLWGIGRDELERLTLAQTGRYLLVEFPYPGWPRDLAAAIRYLGEARDQGTSRPPGAEPGGPGSPRCARPAVDEGALVQVTAGSLEGRHGAGARAPPSASSSSASCTSSLRTRTARTSPAAAWPARRGASGTRSSQDGSRSPSPPRSSEGGPFRALRGVSASRNIRRVDRSVQTDARAKPAHPGGRRPTVDCLRWLPTVGRRVGL
jgi:hypothetical protein